MRICRLINYYLPTRVPVARWGTKRKYTLLLLRSNPLCREDELEQIEKVILNLAKLNQDCITIDFGKVTRFADGKGGLIPAIGNNEPFQKLRATILQGLIENPSIQEPHITLMHPRNSTCSDRLFEQIKKVEFPHKISFRKVSLIEQEVGKKWHVLQEFALKDKNRP